ncbi:hypothetical protein LguiA_030553 [Lonicera macranthoides]
MECVEVDLNNQLNRNRAFWRLLLEGFGWLRFVEIERFGFTDVGNKLLQTHTREDEGEWSKAAKL